MKRSFVVALALALGLSATVGASVQGSTEPAAKKGAKRQSLQRQGRQISRHRSGEEKRQRQTLQSQRHGQSRASARTCSHSYARPTGRRPVRRRRLQDAAAQLDLTVSGGATSVVLKYVPPGGCVTINYTSLPVTLTKSGDTWTASETRAFSLVGEPANVKWDLTIKEPGPTYALNFTMDSNTMIGACKWEGHPTGTLAKVG